MVKTPFRRLAAIIPHPARRRKTEDETSEKKKKNGKATASAVAAMTAAGVLVGGAFSSPTDILDDGTKAVVQSLDMAAPAAEDGGAGADEGGESTEDKRGVYAAVRRLVRAAPAEVRALVAVPLWALGTGANAAASALWSAALSPAVSAVLSWLGLALMAALIFTLAVKTAFPDLPLKKILNKRSLLTIVSLCLLFGLADAVLPFFWEDYALLSRLLRVIGSFVCTGVPVAFFLRRHKRKAPEEIVAEVVEPEAEISPEEKDAAARALIEELADSVCPRTR